MSKKERKPNMDNLERNRKRFSFKFASLINRIIIRKPKVKFLGEQFPDEPIMLLANHVGKQTPVKLEQHYPRDFRMWGTHETTEGFKAAHKYLRTTYYHEKKHMPKFFAFIVASLAAPFANMFFKGMRIIPTYTDYRFYSTIKMTLKAVEEGKDIVIYPEDSSKGYMDQLTGLHPGFASFLDILYKQGKDMLVYCTYLNRKKNLFIVSEGIHYSELKNKYGSYEEIAEAMRVLINSLADK